MTDFRQAFYTPVASGTSASLQLQLTDGDDADLAGNVVDEVTLTLFDRATGRILNSRSASNVLNAGGGTLSDSGLLDLDLSPADNAMADAGACTEEHVARLDWTWNGGDDTGTKEMTFTVIRRLAPA
jgi:hypothetical protein